MKSAIGAQLVSVPDVATDSSNDALKMLVPKNTVSVKELQREGAE